MPTSDRATAGPYTLVIPPNGRATLYEADGAGIDHEVPFGINNLDALIHFAGEVIRLNAMIGADEKPGHIPQWRAFHAAAWPKLWGIETTDPRAVEAGLEIVIAPCMPEHTAKSVVAIFNQQAPDFTHRETLLTLLELLNPLHGEIDRQTYEDRYKQGFDAPADAEYTVDITARMERDLTQAVVILEDRLRGQPK